MIFWTFSPFVRFIPRRTKSRILGFGTSIVSFVLSVTVGCREHVKFAVQRFSTEFGNRSSPYNKLRVYLKFETLIKRKVATRDVKRKKECR